MCQKKILKKGEGLNKLQEQMRYESQGGGSALNQLLEGGCHKLKQGGSFHKLQKGEWIKQSSWKETKKLKEGEALK